MPRSSTATPGQIPADIARRTNAKPSKDTVRNAVITYQRSEPHSPEWEAARDTVLFSITAMAQHYASRATRNDHLRADLFQIAITRALEVMSVFDPQRGTFAGYAALCMRRAIRQYMDEEFAVTNLFAVSLDKTPRSSSHSLHSQLADPNAGRSEFIDFTDREQLYTLLRDAGLTDREMETLTLVFWKGMSLADAARQLNTSRERTRQLKSTALGKLRTRASWVVAPIGNRSQEIL